MKRAEWETWAIGIGALVAVVCIITVLIFFRDISNWWTEHSCVLYSEEAQSFTGINMRTIGFASSKFDSNVRFTSKQDFYLALGAKSYRPLETGDLEHKLFVYDGIIGANELWEVKGRDLVTVTRTGSFLCH